MKFNKFNCLSKAFLGLGAFWLAFSPLQADSGLLKVQSLSGETKLALPRKLLVRYRNGRASAKRTEFFKSHRVTPAKRFDAINVDVVSVPPNASLEETLQRLEKDPNVEFAEPVAKFYALATANDPDYSNQWYLNNSHIRVEQAWDITQGNPSIVVAVVDTGVTLGHPDLSPNLWINPSPSGNAGLNGTRTEIDLDDDGICNEMTIFGSDQCAGTDPTDNDTRAFHGTHVAGIIAAKANNGTDIAGIAPNCRIMAVKVLNELGEGTTESIIDGVLFAADHGASVINLSLGGPSRSDALEEALKYALAKNVVVVAASGNDGPCPVMYPAAYDRVIAVGATDINNQVADFSCSGRVLDVVAPGVDILSTNQAGTSSLDGTSFAAPMVSGVAALIRSVSPTMPVDDVTRYIAFRATDLRASGHDTATGFGLLNAASSIRSANDLEPFISNPASPNETFPYPNPFNPMLGVPAVIAIPTSLGAQDIKINFYTLAGEQVATLNGTNKWDGRNEDGSYVASGLYFYIVETSKGNITGKMTILK